MSMSIFLSICFIATSCYILRYSQRTKQSSKLPLPPGPTGRFLLGNALDIPSEESWVWYGKLKAQYGDIVYLTAMGTPIVILNSYKVINELFSKRAAKYSNRPRNILAGEIMGVENATTLTQYGPVWKAHRSLWHQSLGKNSLPDYDEHISQVVQKMTRKLIHDSSSITRQLRLLVVTILMGAAYGIKVDSLDEEFIATTDIVDHDVIDGLTPGRHIVEILPILKYIPGWFPGAGWKRFGLRARAGLARVVEEPFERVKRTMATGDYQKSFVSGMINSSLGTEEIQKWVAATVYIAGADTTHTATSQFVALMLLHPEAQRKAQEDIDSVVGAHRLPTIDDQESLPYIDALIQEVLRWNCMVPIAVPHVATEDDEYEGYFIPKGALCISNLWAITTDPEMYPEPEKFKPERFLVPDSEGKASKPLDPRSIVFGIGRRVCPGRHFAERVLYQFIVTVLATCNILNPLDGDGKEIKPDIRFAKNSILQELIPFEARIEVKSPEALALLSTTA